MDSIEVFGEKLANELDGIPAGAIKPTTNYREIPDWSSMHALVLIALAETEYGVTLTGEDLRKCNTVQDIYEVIKSRAT